MLVLTLKLGEETLVIDRITHRTSRIACVESTEKRIRVGFHMPSSFIATRQEVVDSKYTPLEKQYVNTCRDGKGWQAHIGTPVIGPSNTRGVIYAILPVDLVNQMFQLLIKTTDGCWLTAFPEQVVEADGSVAADTAVLRLQTELLMIGGRAFDNDMRIPLQALETKLAQAGT